jgi:hypothetical protein
MAPVPVKVNLDVTVDASGTINVFGQAPPSIPTPVVSKSTVVLASDFYKGLDNSLFKFWETSGNIIDISGAINNDFVTASVGANVKALFSHLSSALGADILDASGVAPFSGYSSDNEAYWKFNGFGRLALSAYAHDIFGHVAATAAITNDQAFIDRMNANASETSLALSVNNGMMPAATTSLANLAAMLVYKIVKMDAAAATAVVKQVIGQDASRAMGEDNNALAPDGSQALTFLPGDIIYVKVNLLAATVELAAGQQATTNGNLTPNDGDLGTPATKEYVIEITLA